jgi:D-beta-D-heptose 7-phosphate kinase/D-beta-D-heptose 1-phosphate adenosyltransferase
MDKKKVIWVNGCFDIIHPGHIELLKYAKSLGGILIIGIDSDIRVNNLKGNNRPINNQEFRKTMLEAIRYVDEVFIFNDEIEMCDILIKNSVDLIVIGDEYIGRKITGSDICDVEFFSKIPNISSSSIINKINNANDI